MSAVSAAARDERMLSGVSAFQWTRVNLIAYLICLVLGPAWVVTSFVLHAGAITLFLLIPLLAAAAVAGVCSLGGFLRGRSESEAGYITLPGSFPNLDQLDFRTGILIRRAGDPLLATRSTLAFLRGDPGVPRAAPGDDEPGFAASSPLALVGIVLQVVVGLVIFVGVGIVRGRSDPAAILLTASLLVGSVGGVLLLVVAQTRVTLVRRIRVIAAQRPSAMIFTSAITPDLRAGTERLGNSSGPTWGRFPVVVTESAIELWSNEATPVVRITAPWTDVLSVQPDRVAVSRNSFRGLDVRVTHDDVTAQLPLPIYGRGGIFGASRSWANQVFDEIRHHLTSRRVARPARPAVRHRCTESTRSNAASGCNDDGRRSG